MSSTCLDHIYTTHPSFIANISKANIGPSDNLPVVITRKYSRKQKDQIHSTIEYDDLKNLNTDESLQDLQCTPWDAVFMPEVMKTGSANLNVLCNFSQLPLSNISLFTALFTPDVRFFLLSFLLGICLQVDVDIITVVRRPVNSNLGLQVNQINAVSSLQMFFVYSFCFQIEYRFCD